ncbi:MAG: S41 family peptidase [Planctomycetota bacterium]|nr:S41 family peptidase [Planctomycetota bacterium]
MQIYKEQIWRTDEKRPYSGARLAARAGFSLSAALVAAESEDADEPSKSSEPEKQKVHYFEYDLDYVVNTVQDALRLVRNNFRGDNEVKQNTLVAAGVERLGKYVEALAKKEDGEDLSSKLAPVLDGDIETERATVEALKKLPENGELPYLDISDELIRGMVIALKDPFSHFFTLQELQALTGMLEEGSRDYYGMIPRPQADGSWKVVHVGFGSPAYYCGIQPDDRIVSFNDTAVSELEREDIAKLLSPEEPVDLRIGVKRKGWRDSHQVVLKPSLEPVPRAIGAYPGKNFGYVRATLFSTDIGEQVHGQLKKLTEQGAKAFVLDLRNNPGGNAQGAVELCDLFLRGRKVVTMFKMMNASLGLEQPMFAPGMSTPYENVPLVCLINESSASASEMTSGALQDHHRATVMGKKSYGKGCAQAPLGVPASRGSRFLYITIAKYFLPSGRTIHLKGVEPDIEVNDGPEGFRSEEFFMAMNSERAFDFARRAFEREPELVKRVCYSEPQLLERLPSYRSAARRISRMGDSDISPATVYAALRQALIYRYTSETEDVPAYDVRDRAFVEALERLEKESGLELGPEL